jgi:glycosyltransferase involved in cell wall biosynthesis
MIVLFIHQNFPAQYRHLARHLADRRGNRVIALSQPNDNEMLGVRKISYTPEPRTGSGCHRLAHDFDHSVRAGAAVAEACRELKKEGIRPDIVIGHNGWGETLLVKDVFPDVPLLAYFEFFYSSKGADVNFDPEFDPIFSEPARLRVRNAVNFLGFDAADWGHTPTHWQRSLYPSDLRQRLSVIHEGVDTDVMIPDPTAWIELARDGIKLSRQDEVITYVARDLEPYRGFHILMRALPEILRRRPRAHVVIVGGDGVSYGSPLPPGMSYREMMLAEVGNRLDLARVHFVGQIPYDAYAKILQISSAHIYLTYPFVLSWSFIEAMASGCLVIGSATPPVLEVLQDRVNGLTFDFFSPDALADRVEEVFSSPDRIQAIRDAARATAVKNFDLKRRQLPLWENLIKNVANGRKPSLDLRGNGTLDDGSNAPQTGTAPSGAGTWVHLPNSSAI